MRGPALPTMTMLEVTVLGGFELRLADGDPLKLGTRKAEALLAILAAAAADGQRGSVSRDRVLALLWPDSPEAQARASLRQALATARKGLGGGTDALRTDGEGMSLDPALASIDAVTFARAIAAGELERAVALYRGDFLDGFTVDEAPFDEWVGQVRARLRGAALRALEKTLAAAVERGDAVAGVPAAERLLVLEPASEAAFQALMRLHAAVNRPDEAIRAYERCRSALASAVGIPPSPETESLLREIRARAATRADVPAATPTIAVVPFVADEPSARALAQGLSDGIATELARFRTVRVVTDGASSADYFLRGTVRGNGAQVRVTARLHHGSQGEHVWGDRYDVTLEDPFGVEDELTRRIVGAVVPHVDERRLARARGVRGGGLTAYDLWLRGLDCLRRGQHGSDVEARALFQQALEVQPDFARAYSGLSLSHFNEWSCHAWDRWDETQERAFEYADRAVQMDDADAVGQCILGKILLYRREFDRAEKHLDRALSLNPNDADNLAHIGIAKAQLGHAELGLELARTARRINARHPDWYLGAEAFSLVLLRRWREGMAVVEAAPDAYVDTRALLAAGAAMLDDDARCRVHREAFLANFQRHIVHGRTPEPGEAARWVMHVNPLRRPEDTALLEAALRRAGLVSG